MLPRENNYIFIPTAKYIHHGLANKALTVLTIDPLVESYYADTVNVVNISSFSKLKEKEIYSNVTALIGSAPNHIMQIVGDTILWDLQYLYTYIAATINYIDENDDDKINSISFPEEIDENGLEYVIISEIINLLNEYYCDKKYTYKRPPTRVTRRALDYKKMLFKYAINIISTVQASRNRVLFSTLYKQIALIDNTYERVRKYIDPKSNIYVYLNSLGPYKYFYRLQNMKDIVTRNHRILKYDTTIKKKYYTKTCFVDKSLNSAIAHVIVNYIVYMKHEYNHHLADVKAIAKMVQPKRYYIHADTRMRQKVYVKEMNDIDVDTTVVQHGYFSNMIGFIPLTARRMIVTDEGSYRKMLNYVDESRLKKAF